MRVLSLSVWEGLPYLSIWILPNLCPVREHYIFLPVSKLDGLNSVLLDALNRSIREDALLFPIREDTLYGAIRESKI